MATPEPTTAPSPGRRERKKAETRRRILACAARIFTSKGFEAATVDEIAEAADISRATLFNYFPEKAALMTELGEGMSEAFLERVAEARRAEGNIEERLAGLFARSAERLEERPDLARTVVHETIGRRSRLDEPDNLTHRLHAAMELLLRDAVDRGEVRTDVPLPLLAQLVSGAYVEVLMTWLIDAKYPLAEHLQLTAGVLGTAIAPPNAGAARSRTASSNRKRASRGNARKRAPRR